jgi:hypothetical protein
LESKVSSPLIDESIFEITKKILAKRKDARNHNNGINLMATDVYHCCYLSSHKNRELIATIASLG